MCVHYCFINRPDKIVTNDEAICVHNFFISSNELDFYHLMDSCIASPARYIHEVVNRCYSQKIDSDLIVFNPYYYLPKWQLTYVIKQIIRYLDMSSELCIFSDRAGRPIAYFFARCDERLAQILFYLSASDSLLDQKLLQAYIGPCRLIKLESIQVYSLPTTGFGSFSSKYLTDITEQALSNQEAVTQFKNRACMFYHAGDLLFFLEALNRSSFRYFQEVATCEAYRDIAKIYVSENILHLIKIRPFNRDHADILLGENEDIHLSKLMNSLDSKSINFNFRHYYRLYQSSTHHLVDQYGFALGINGMMPSSLFIQGLNHEPISWLAKVKRPHVFIHFDAGWGLKEYPKKFRIELLEKLKNIHLTVTVLDDSSFIYPDWCNVIKFKGLSQLQSEILQSDLMIGMDSFPIHYANIVLNWKTILLFGSTHPNHSKPALSEHNLQIYDSKRMDCCPCFQLYSCARYQSSECLNFSDPNTVIQHVERILNCKSEAPEIDFFPINRAFRKKRIRGGETKIINGSLDSPHIVVQAKQMYLDFAYPFIASFNTFLRWVYTKGISFTVRHILNKIFNGNGVKN